MMQQERLPARERCDGQRRDAATSTRSENSGDELAAGLEATRAYWERRARTPGSNIEKLEWTHVRTQRARFEAFLREHDLRGSSILDVGCGLGDLYAHLLRRGIEVDYTGYDLAPEMVRLCRARYPGIRFESGDFLRFLPPSRFDYAVAFGIHNIRVPGGRAILEAVTRHQFDLSAVAAHVSLLTDRYTAFASRVQAWRAEDILGLALGITPYVALHHEHLENDFSVTLYRRPASKDFVIDYPEE